MPEDKSQNISLDLHFDVEEPFSSYAKKNVMVLISILKEVKGSKRPTHEAIHAKLIEEVVEQRPESLFVLVAGLLKRWNYWEMVRELSDEELVEYLSDIPPNLEEEVLNRMLAKKFSVVAKKLEQETLGKLKHYLHRLNLTNIEIYTWHEREKLKEFSTEAKEYFVEPNAKDFETTREEFLTNKNNLLKKAENRMIKAQSNLSHINFDKLTKYACHDYLLEEYVYFGSITKGAILHRGRVPAALESIFSIRKDLGWHTFFCKESIIKKPEINLLRSCSTAPQNQKYSKRKLKLFPPLKILNEPKNEKHYSEA